MEVTGCAAVVRGGLCVLAESERRLTLWVDAPGSTALRIAAGGRTLEAEGRAEVDGGTRLSVEVPPGAAALLVDADGEGLAARGALALRDEAPRALAPIDRLRRQGKCSEAAEALRSSGARDRALGLEGRLAICLGEGERGRALLERAIATDAIRGLVSEQVADSIALGYHLENRLGRLADAEAVLSRAWSAAAGFAPGRASLAYHRALVARDSGDLRDALARLDEAAAVNERLDLGRRRIEEQLGRADVLRSLGRHAEALAVVEGLAERADLAEADRCLRGAVLNDLGWQRVMAAARTHGDAALAEGPLEGALALFREGCRPWSTANCLVNLALAALLRGELDLAGRYLAESRATLGKEDAALGPWWADIAGKIALARGDAERARRIYADLAARAGAAASPASTWQAEVGLGRALEASERPEEAIAAYRLAEQLLDDQTSRVPLDAGRESLLATREESASLLVGALLASGETERALEAARRARARPLAALRRSARVAGLDPEERRAWQEAIGAYRRLADQLERGVAESWPPPASRRASLEARWAATREEMRRTLDRAYALLANGEAPPSPPRGGPPEQLSLLYFPVGASGGRWAAFAWRDDDVRGVELPALPDPGAREALSEALLAPFADLLDGASLVRVLAYGVLQDVDFHALPWRGGVLLEKAPVVYALDVGPARSGAGGGEVVLVGDPEGNLPGARAEIARISALLTERGGGGVRVLRGRQASGPAVRGALSEAALLHYAGHGEFAGRGGWESALPLAERGALTVGDILTLPRVPERVVLSGCETGRHDSGLPVPGVGIAQAFVAAGALEVVAATRIVSDARASRLSVRVHELRSEPGSSSLAEAVRRAQLELREGDEGSDWAAWRVFVP